MEVLTIELILEKINNLTGKIDDGFKGTHRRIDKSNHRMAKQEARADRHKSMIVDLEKTDIKHSERTKTSRVFWITMTTLITICSALASFIFGKYL